MILSELIALATLRLQQHGDIEVLSPYFSPINRLNHMVSDGTFDEEWNMPEGYEYIMIREGQ